MFSFRFFILCPGGNFYGTFTKKFNKTAVRGLLIASLALLMGAIASPAWALTPTEIDKLLASDGAEDDLFGVSVAMSGDTAVIGAFFDEDNGNFAGSAYVFTRDSAGNWSQQTKLTDSVAFDLFGGSVAVDGDTAVIGANGNTGSAYVYTRNGTGNWSLQEKIIEPPGAASVAISGDTVMIGSLRDVGGGAAYVFTRDGTGNWSQQAKLTPPAGFSGGSFGFSVAVMGDTAVIGTPGDNENGSQSGSAFVFVRDGSGNWSERAKLTAADATKDDRFGISVARSGDTIMIGASDDDDDNNGTLQTGSAYVFTRDGTGNWSQQEKLTAPDAIQFGGFGRPVAVEDDIAVIGTGGSGLQAAYVFTRDGTGSWSQEAKITASDASQFNQFGRSIAMAGDTALIGAPGQRQGVTQSGAVYVFSLGLAQNEAPSANAGPDQAVRVGDTAFLDGSASFDDNTPTGLLQYAWSLSSLPAGSSAILTNPDTSMPNFVADVSGTYVVQLVVTDEGGLESPADDVIISSENLAPTAEAGPDQLVVVGSIVFLDGSLSTDPENDPLTYSWALTSTPLGSIAALIGAGTATPNFSVDLEGLYEATLVVSDAIGPGTPDIVEIIAISSEQFAEIEIISAGEIVVGLGAAQVTTQGNQNALSNFLIQAAIAIQEGDLAEAINKLQKALLRTDGCELRGAPDANGPGRDWITECAAQSSIYSTLNSALGALTP